MLPGRCQHLRADVARAAEHPNAPAPILFLGLHPRQEEPVGPGPELAKTGGFIGAGKEGAPLLVLRPGNKGGQDWSGALRGLEGNGKRPAARLRELSDQEEAEVAEGGPPADSGWHPHQGLLQGVVELLAIELPLQLLWVAPHGPHFKAKQ